MEGCFPSRFILSNPEMFHAFYTPATGLIGSLYSNHRLCASLLASWGVSHPEGNFDAYIPSFREYFLPEALALLFGELSALAARLRASRLHLFLCSF
jgi:hypothetical protein